ncbi:MAG: hypothetical protein GY758_00120 [Fuerstiella sp.]|nr:hypothetical protein [Fuerstiella sp.]MCP4508389.1 hypothetical protein [Fuerstiella sp.]
MRILLFFLITIGAAVTVSWLRSPPQDHDPARPAAPTLIGSVPPQGADDEFAGAETCTECHVKEHATWHRSYHRSMTQVASPEAVVAPFAGETFTDRGGTYRFFRRKKQFFVSLPDIDEQAEAERRGSTFHTSTARQVERQIVMTTGSHHYQAYWINSRLDNQLWRVPFVFHINRDRWIPVEDSFLTPPSEHARISRWNDSCIQCHAVRGRPDRDLTTERYDTTVVDFGIACEACHGPGREHVDFHRQKPSEESQPPDVSMVNPTNLGHRRSSQICGRCHSQFSFTDLPGFLMNGLEYRAGDDIHKTRYMHNFKDEHVQQSSHLLNGYWSDGTMRLGGREFTAMQDADCYRQGSISCTTCHSMHSYEDRSDQLRPGMRSSRACLQCHSEYETRITEHTHHGSSSPGSNCLNCHMPHTSFGLLKSIRSHRIDSPSLGAPDRPNACNLCHLDKTLAWTDDQLHKWYDITHVNPDVDAKTPDLSAAVDYLLSGDAVQRAVMANAFASTDAKKTSGDQWQVPLLTHLLDDSYSVVRFIAERTIRTYDGFEDVDYDFLAPAATRRKAAERILEQWSKQQRSFQGVDIRSVLLNPDGTANHEEAVRRYHQRDNRPIEFPE